MSTIERIEDLADPPFNPYLADEVVFGDIADPYSVIHEIRTEGPVVAGSYRERLGLPPQPESDLGTGGHFIVLSFAAVNQVLNDPLPGAAPSLRVRLRGPQLPGAAHGSARDGPGA